MSGNLVETLIGAIVLVVAGVFLAFAYTSSGARTIDGYELLAKFDRIDGLSPGNDVRMSGIKVGTIVEQSLESDTYFAVVRMEIDPTIRLPEDSSAKITSEGLLGGNYLALEPGGSDEILEAGDEIAITQGSVDLLGLISQAVFSISNSKSAEGETE
jgi:phospholipid/cholesterol/gamma-HCH transport system substrate-binding protein